jgi:glutaredoxin
MKVQILSKEGCNYCDKSVEFLKSLGSIPYEKVIVDKKTLQEKVQGATTYPQILVNDVHNRRLF